MLISINGLRAGEVREAADRQLKLPNLAGIFAQGAHAEGVIGVLPSFTLPSHVTLLTGVSPAKHGVYNNLAFLPQNAGGAPGLGLGSAIKAQTLWEAAHSAGLHTLSVNWPVSLGARGLDFNISGNFVAPGSTQDDDRFNRLLSTPGLADRLEREIGPIRLVTRHGAAGEAEDEKIAARLIADEKPYLATIHFGGLDEAEHTYGPGSPEAKAALEAIDTYIGQLVAAARTAQPDTVVAVVSDHGFTAVTREVSLPRAFVDAGLIKIDGAGKLVSWEAAPWAAGGSAAVILARPDDKELVARVAALLNRLKADPALGIEEVLDASELARRGGFPGASFGVTYRLDTTGPAARPFAQPLVSPAVQKGTHGHSPTHRELYSTFIIAGPGVPVGRDLGVIDMRTIAPTLAGILGTNAAGQGPFAPARMGAFKGTITRGENPCPFNSSALSVRAMLLRATPAPKCAPRRHGMGAKTRSAFRSHCAQCWGVPIAFCRRPR